MEKFGTKKQMRYETLPKQTACLILPSDSTFHTSTSMQRPQYVAQISAK